MVNVLAGGIDTTQSQLAHALRLFAAHPEQWALLGRRPELVPQAVTEVLRFEPITPFTARLCVQQVEHRGVVFPAGTIVAICAERANREPSAATPATAPGAPARRATRSASTSRSAARTGAELRRRAALLPGRQSRPRGAGGGARLPRAADAGLATDGAAELGGVEGIYGVNVLPLRWTRAAAGFLTVIAVSRGPPQRTTTG